MDTCSSNPCWSGVHCVCSAFYRWDRWRLSLVKPLPQHHVACSVVGPWRRVSSFASLFFTHSLIRTFASSGHLLLLWASQWASLPLSHRGKPSLGLQLSSKRHPANLLLIIGGEKIFLARWTCFPGANVYLPCLPSILPSIKSSP